MQSYNYILFATGTMLLAGQAHGIDAPTNLADWGLHCWCLTARHTPQRVVRDDNNGRVLWLLRNGMTRAALDQALPGVRDSQLALLETYGLVNRTGDTYRAAFPVLAPETVGLIRARMDSLARRTVPALRADVDVITASARSQGHRESGYAMVFGYALDGAIWEALGRRTPLPDTALDLDHPFWRGAFWAIYPERTDAPGSNEVRVGPKSLFGVWTNHTVVPLNAALDRAQANGLTDNLKSLPEITDRPGDAVHDAGQRIAMKLVGALLDSDDGRAALELFPSALRQQAILAVAHEFIWSTLNQLVRDGAVRTPAALTAELPSDAQTRALMFLVRHD